MQRIALLALQRGLVSPDQLLEAWVAWAGQPQDSLADLLVRRGWVSPQQRGELESLSLAAPTPLPITPDEARKAFELLDRAGPWGPDGDEAGADEGAFGRYARTQLHAEGGMGLVWRARDERLGRQVALKEMRPELDGHPEVSRRFLAEARITGQLEHPGIVPVYEMIDRPGETPYYTMRLVRGRTLSQAARDLHQRPRASRRVDEVALRDLLGAFVSVCNTLAYAHSRGVVHCDLKGANVVLGDYGEVVVLDWGLAKVLPGEAPGGEDGPVVPLPDGEAGQTLQGTISGTPDYMAPEQASGEGRVDARTDVFGLGAMLYEVLTGGPPHRGATKPEKLARARDCQVVPPRRLVRWVPRPLQATCLKALAKDPAGRYAGAGELAEELKRWMAGEPVGAWPEPWHVKAGRWVRRHRVLTAAAAAALAVALALGGGGLAWWEVRQARDHAARVSRQDQARERAVAAVEQAREDRDRAHWGSARRWLEQAEKSAREAGDGATWAHVRQARADFELVHDLNRVREEAATLVKDEWRPGRVREQYPEVFRKHGLDVLGGDPGSLAKRIRTSAVRAEALAALDDWTAWEQDVKRLPRLLEVARRVDDASPWRRLLKPRLARDPGWVKAFVGGLREDRMAPASLVFVSEVLRGVPSEALALLARAQERHPADFWLAFRLAKELHQAEKPRLEEAIGYYRSARALRPGSSAIHSSLGVALQDRGDLEAALASHREAVRLGPKSALAHTNLGNALYARGDLEGAVVSYRKAIGFGPEHASAHTNLGTALHARRDLDGAIRSHRTAIRLDRTLAMAHSSLGVALQDRGDLEAALASHREAVRLGPRLAMAHNNLGNALKTRGDLGGAIASFQKAIALGPKQALVYYNLGNALLFKKDLDGAIANYREAVRVDRKYATAHVNLGVALAEKKDLDGAVASFREAIRVDPKAAQAHYNLGLALHTKGDLDGAIDCFKVAAGLDPNCVPAHFNLATTLRAKGDLPKAIASYRKAIRLDPALAPAYRGMGLVLLERGELTAARGAIQRALELLPRTGREHRSALRQLDLCENALKLERLLGAVLAGKAAPASADERLRLAEIAQLPGQRRYAAAAGLYANAFQAEPGLAKDLAAGHRYNAACAAARAGTGEGHAADQFDAKERARLLSLALGWLKDDLAAHAEQLSGCSRLAAATSREALAHWRRDPDLAAVRDVDRLAKLPEAPRAAWRDLWARVDNLLLNPKADK